MVSRMPGEGRYAHVEREQRWLLDRVPDGAGRPVRIEDRYVTGTRLRLRRADDGHAVLHKLAQKVRPTPGNPETVKLTNIYLDADEFDALRHALPGRDLEKTRLGLDHAGRSYAIDVFAGPLAGLVVAETELEPGDARLPMPPFALADVTDDDRYSGGSLASAGRIPEREEA